jgi:predicted glycoside hydrolase/deacetylase ChbG (UPF0249 family)
MGEVNGTARNADEARLIVTADDYGYVSAYDEGILEAARAGAVDAVSAMVGRERCDPTKLVGAGIEIGLHLELPAPEGGADGPDWSGAGRASDREREVAGAALSDQLARFEDLFGAAPAFLNGHHHCHARPGLANIIARVAAERALPVRSVSARHRRLLRCLGVDTPDRLLGRLAPSEPALPSPLEGGGEDLPRGVSEWMVHPGKRDPGSGSAYDAAREEDLELVLRLRDVLLPLRGTHARTL